MARAQNGIASHPGKPGLGLPLTRLTDKRKIARNRRVACRNVRPGKGQSCDEYPFASTHQGAALAGHGNFRSEAVNDRQNKLVGTRLSTFYSRYRIADGDKFFVHIVG